MVGRYAPRRVAQPGGSRRATSLAMVPSGFVPSGFVRPVPHCPIVTARRTTARASSIASLPKPLGRPREQPVEGTGALGQVGREHLMARPQAQKVDSQPSPDKRCEQEQYESPTRPVVAVPGAPSRLASMCTSSPPAPSRAPAWPPGRRSCHCKDSPTSVRRVTEPASRARSVRRSLGTALA
jgi:hypothetical protein